MNFNSIQEAFPIGTDVVIKFELDDPELVDNYTVVGYGISYSRKILVHIVSPHTNMGTYVIPQCLCRID